MKLYLFRTVRLSIIRSFSLYTRQWYMSYRFADGLRAGSGRNCTSILILLASCQQTYMSYTIAVCTVKNSWWWRQKLSETSRVSIQNKNFEKLAHLVGSIIRNLSRCTVTWTSNMETWLFNIPTRGDISLLLVCSSCFLFLIGMQAITHTTDYSVFLFKFDKTICWHTRILRILSCINSMIETRSLCRVI